MNPLSRKLNDKYLIMKVKCEDVSHTCNYLLFVDNLKLLGSREINDELRKSSDRAPLLENSKGCKYLEITDDERSVPTKESLNSIREKLLTRVEWLYKTSLSGKTLLKAINEHAVSLINYYVDVLKLKTKQLCQLG